jgi:hypothetical protein
MQDVSSESVPINAPPWAMTDRPFLVNEFILFFIKIQFDN